MPTAVPAQQLGDLRIVVQRCQTWIGRGSPQDPPASAGRAAATDPGCRFYATCEAPGKRSYPAKATICAEVHSRSWYS